MRFGSTTGHCIPAAPPPGPPARLQAPEQHGTTTAHGDRKAPDATWTPQHPHCRSLTVQPCAMVPWAKVESSPLPFVQPAQPTAQPPRQAKQRHSAPCQLGHTLMMKPPDGGPPHSSNGKQPTHQTQSILRRINIHTSIMTNEYRGMTCSQNDRTVDNAHDGASNHPPPIVSRKRTENKNKYLSIPYLDPCQVDNLIYLRSCNISFVPDKSF